MSRVRRPAAAGGRTDPPLVQRVYALLSDRRFHSGSALAEECGVSRSAVWKSLRMLRRLGAEVHAVANRGYRLPDATAPLAAAAIRRGLRPETTARLRDLAVVWTTGSTNADLLRRPAAVPGVGEVLLAEYQSDGRGRRGRHWLAPPGGALCLSLSWQFAAMPADVAALGLAIGVCTLRALQAVGASGAALKWPNDLLVGDAKLGGILIELRAEAAGPAQAVIGIGLNVALGQGLHDLIRESGTRAADLTALGVENVDRNALAAALIGEFVRGLEEFGQRGFAPFAAEWRAADALAGRPVSVSGETGSVQGHARGIDADGALCVQTRDGLRRFMNGDVSVRVDA